MKTIFDHPNFLLENDFAAELYHDYAKAMPILDYHCHLPPEEIAQDVHFESITQVWLGADHYKWRQMRTNGVDERFCTGDASDWEKFEKWAETVPGLLRNPLYHWTHLELKHPFGITDRYLNPETAAGIYEACNEMLGQPGFSCRNLMKKSNVAGVCTTDDPVDTLKHHKAIAADPEVEALVLPTFRPDKAMAVEDLKAFNAYLDKLAAAADVEIKDFDSLLEALRRRHDFFHSMGCRLSDHGIETIYAEPYTEAEVKSAFQKARGGTQLSGEQTLQFKSAVLYECGVMDWEKGWTQQYHLGAMRNNNTRMFQKLGPDTGFDSIGDFEIARPMARLFDWLEREGKLAKTIIYNLNPADNEVLSTMLGNFQDGSVPGKLQHGSGWWFNDHIDGMQRHMESLSNLGMLSRFVGMLTDSRSFLSYARHEYFRRILCNMLGRDMAAGLIPADMELVGNIVRDISYRNARDYFGFGLEQ